jgi:hypothetical protein
MFVLVPIGTGIRLYATRIDRLRKYSVQSHLFQLEMGVYSVHQCIGQCKKLDFGITLCSIVDDRSEYEKRSIPIDFSSSTSSLNFNGVIK